MRSTTVGWLTSILRVLPVIADHKWLNRVRPEFRDNTNHPTEPTDSTPRNSPMKRANTTAAEDRAGLGEWEPASGSRGILQDYHPDSGGIVADLRQAAQIATSQHC